MKRALVYLFLIRFIESVCCLCTQPNVINPCYCENEEHYVTLHCKDIADEISLIETYSLYAGSKIEALKISNSNLSFIPTNYDTLKEAKLIYITQSSLDFLFADILPSTLDTLIIDGLEFKYGMMWGYLEDLRNLEVLMVRDTDIPDLDEGIEKSVSRKLSILMLRDTNTLHLHERVFRKFAYLSDLRIESGSVRKLKRRMFPRPAHRLEKLSFE